MAFKARFEGTCRVCNGHIYVGDEITWARSGSSKGRVKHMACSPTSETPQETPNPNPTPTPESTPEPHSEAPQVPNDNPTSEPEPIPEEPKPEPEPEPVPRPKDYFPTTGSKYTGKGGDAIIDMLGDAILERIDGKINDHSDTVQIFLGELSSKVENELARLKKEVEEKINDSRPVVLEVRQDNLPDVKIENAHKQLRDLIKLIQRKHVYLYGAPGGGKSTAARQAAKALGRRFAYVSLDETTPGYILTGYKDANGNYHSTLFRELYEQGGIFCIEELDNANGNLLTALNCALENGYGAFPDGQIECSKDFRVVGCGNTSGRGAHPAFPERRPFDWAFADRFFYVEWQYDLDLEKNIALAINPNSRPLVSWVQGARKFVEENRIKLLLSPRASYTLAELSLDPEFTDDLLLDGVMKGIDHTAKEKVLANYPFPHVSR